MILNIISTVNGIENEGMRNIASHIQRELEESCDVRHSSLGDPIRCIKNSVGADAVRIFARASAKVAYLAKILRIFCSRVYFILVQRPESGFIRSMVKNIRKYSYFSILENDGEELTSLGGQVRALSVGINSEKFRPVSGRDELISLRKKYGLSVDLPLVLHVGHLSSGRGLEAFLSLPKERFERLIVASGMFNSDEIEEKLRSDGVHIIKEYLPDVSEVYRMADVYLFTTRSSEFVISIPLSVTEALSCGTPVVAFSGVDGINNISATYSESLVCISDESELVRAVETAAATFFDNRQTLLSGMCSWKDAAARLLEDIKGDIVPQ